MSHAGFSGPGISFDQFYPLFNDTPLANAYRILKAEVWLIDKFAKYLVVKTFE